MKNQAYFKIGNAFYDYDNIGKIIKVEKITMKLIENNIKIAFEKGYKIPNDMLIDNYIGKTGIFKKETIDNKIIYSLKIN